MDEMGLAELSENNPLKVTHYELEKEEDKTIKVPIFEEFPAFKEIEEENNQKQRVFTISLSTISLFS